MTDRVNTLTVALEGDVRVDADGLQTLVDSIRLLRGVVGVEVNTMDGDAFWALTNARLEVRTKLADALEDVFRGPG